MRFYSLSQVSSQEKNNILSKHREIYNGYKTVHTPVNDHQPLFIQDFANDKNGITVNNVGNVSQYNNKIYMNEDLPKGFPKIVKANPEVEEGLYDIQDIDPDEKGDYVEEDHTDFYEPMQSAFEEDLDEIEGPLYSEVEPAYNFKSKGPMSELDEYYFGDKIEDDDDNFDFESPWCSNCDGDGCEECDGSGMKRNSSFGTSDDEKSTTFSRMKRGQEPEDIDWEDIHKDREDIFTKLKKGKGDVEDAEWEDLDDELKESFFNQKRKINEMFKRTFKYN